ncbi:hypothetical protein CCACVL1_00169 [Corchorus capsularis]|uniref:Uncharacterized protein n=1 Tax=Corchorus capsularis TaxID=210143 RepID=A0A1R3KYC2_COCAP|nr:hypothetical protein CCACVL1_00169 [Corchorus capsularis]
MGASKRAVGAGPGHQGASASVSQRVAENPRLRPRNDNVELGGINQSPKVVKSVAIGEDL